MNKMEIEKCDICGIKTDRLSDYFVMLCPQCKKIHTDIILLKKIGFLMSKIEQHGKIK